MNMKKYAFIAITCLLYQFAPLETAHAEAVRPLHLPKLTEISRYWKIQHPPAGRQLEPGLVIRARGSNKYFLYTRYNNGQITRVIAGERNRSAQAICSVRNNHITHCVWLNNEYGTAESAKNYAYTAYRFFLAKHNFANRNKYIKLSDLSSIVNSWKILRSKPEAGTVVKGAKAGPYAFLARVTNGRIKYIMVESNKSLGNIAGCRIAGDTAYNCVWVKSNYPTSKASDLIQTAYRYLEISSTPSSVRGISKIILGWPIGKTAGPIQSRIYRYGNRTFFAITNSGKVIMAGVSMNDGSKATCSVSTFSSKWGSMLTRCFWDKKYSGLRSPRSAQLHVYKTYQAITRHY